MKKINYTLVAALLSGCAILSSCGTQQMATSTSTQKNNSALAGALLTTVAGSSQNSQVANAASAVNTAVNSGSLISGIIGLLVGNTTANTNSIVGTWTYSEPTVQFQSENLLAQAGGVYASQQIVSKLAPYYTKIGVKAGAMKATFNSDKTCVIVLGNKTIQGTYTFDTAKSILNIKGQLGLANISAYATVSANQLALTFDSSKLLTLTTALGAGSQNNILTSISSVAGTYSGMKTGFLFTR